MRKLRTKLSL